jgi:hypothetical protein
MFLFPRAKFVGTNKIEDQLQHLISEVIEVRSAYYLPDMAHLASELCDVVHSAETFLRLLAERLGHPVPWSVEYPCSPPLVSLYAHISRLSVRLDILSQSWDAEDVEIPVLATALIGVIGAAYSALVKIAGTHLLDMPQIRAAVIEKNRVRGYYA